VTEASTVRPDLYDRLGSATGRTPADAQDTGTYETRVVESVDEESALNLAGALDL
jgi:hypothetical protein